MSIKKEIVMPEYLKKISSYIAIGPHGIVPLNYVVEINLAKDKAIIEAIKKDPAFAERFQISMLTPVKTEELAKHKAGCAVISLK
jgi:hypothetical protein